MALGKPPRITKVEEYRVQPPPRKSMRLLHWEQKITNGWRPNRRISTMGYHEASEFYGVYIWEYINVIVPLLDRKPALDSIAAMLDKAK